MNQPSTGATKSGQRTIVVLDRDGVINRDSTTFIKSPDEWIALPGSLEAIERLTGAGLTVVVATNQSGVGRGLFSHADLEKVHAKMTSSVSAAGGRIDAIYFCPHHPDTGCDCRKPEPGMLHKVAEQYGCPADELIVVGDSLRDLQAAWACGATAILVRTGNGRATEQKLPPEPPVDVVDDLTAVADRLVT